MPHEQNNARILMDNLPLSRDDDGEVHLQGTGPVSLQIVYDCVLGTGGQGVVFVGKILGRTDSRVIMKVSGFFFGRGETLLSIHHDARSG